MSDEKESRSGWRVGLGIVAVLLSFIRLGSKLQACNGSDSRAMYEPDPKLPTISQALDRSAPPSFSEDPESPARSTTADDLRRVGPPPSGVSQTSFAQLVRGIEKGDPQAARGLCELLDWGATASALERSHAVLLVKDAVQTERNALTDNEFVAEEDARLQRLALKRKGPRVSHPRHESAWDGDSEPNSAIAEGQDAAHGPCGEMPKALLASEQVIADFLATASKDVLLDLPEGMDPRTQDNRIVRRRAYLYAFLKKRLEDATETKARKGSRRRDSRTNGG